MVFLLLAKFKQFVALIVTTFGTSPMPVDLYDIVTDFQYSYFLCR